MNLKTTLLILIGFTTHSQALNLQINEELTIRVGIEQEGESHYTGQAVGILPKGSIVDIPNQYIVKDSSGKVDIDFTLNKWFEEGGKEFVMGEGIGVFHTPVKVIHPPMGPALSGKNLHIALKNLKLKNAQSTAMNVIEDSELLSVIETSPDETEAGTICTGVCALQNEEMDQSTKDFISKMRDLQENTISQTVQVNSRNRVGSLSRKASNLNGNLQNHCGISQEEICSELEKVIEQYQLPFTCNELVGLLLMESSGICRAINRNKTSSDVGLFQINSVNFKRDIENGNAKLCTDDEFQELVAQARESESAVAFWKAQPKPQCLSNPMYSLRQAGRILAENKRLFTNKVPEITKDEHQDLFRRFILSGYNGGGGHTLRALTDLEIFNTDLQKKLSEGGKDITRSNRGIMQIKREIGVIDNGLQSVNQSLQSLESNIQQTERAVSQIKETISTQERTSSQTASSIETNQQKLKDIPEELDQRITQRRQEMLSKITQEVDSSIAQTTPLIHEWNRLNQQDVSMIAQQQKILLFLDREMNSITDLRRVVDPMSERGRILEVQTKALERFTSEVEEEKWPYYMDQILAEMEAPADFSEGTTAGGKGLRKICIIGCEKHTTDSTQERNGQSDRRQERNRQSDSTHLDLYQIRDKVREITDSIQMGITGLMSSGDEAEWDFYQIRTMERQLENQNRSVRRAMRRDPQKVDKLYKEIIKTRQQLDQARTQRAEDLANILNQNYRDQMSHEERARYLKILESEIEMMKIDTQEELSQADDLQRIGRFFYPTSIMDRVSKFNRLRSTRKDVENSRPKSRKQQSTHPPIDVNVDEERESILFLSNIMTRQYSSHDADFTYLSALQNLENNRTRIDKKRKDLEENDHFQQVKPFLTERRGNDGIRNLEIGPGARHFYESQAFVKYSKNNLDQEIADISRTYIDSSLTSEEIKILQTQMGRLQSELADLRSEKKQQEQQQRVLLVDKIDKLDQEDLLKQQREEVQADLATSKKDPYNWEHIKQFYFAAELKEGIENSGLTSERSSSNAIINITYVDALLGTQGLTGFTESDIGKNLCPNSSES